MPSPGAKVAWHGETACPWVMRRAKLTVAHVGIPTVSTRWYVNGHEITEWAGATSVDVLAKKPKGHGKEAPWCGRKDLRDKRGCTYTVTVTDSTAFVRDPACRQDALTSSVTWRVGDKRH